jgi:hypothetical protein
MIVNSSTQIRVMRVLLGARNEPQRLRRKDWRVRRGINELGKGPRNRRLQRAVNRARVDLRAFHFGRLG